LQENAAIRPAPARCLQGLRNAANTQIFSATARLLLFLEGIMKLFIFIGVNLGGYVGWEAGEPFGMTAAFILSSLGSIGGVILGWKAARHYLA
jgi:hypothetical protein